MNTARDSMARMGSFFAMSMVFAFMAFMILKIFVEDTMVDYFAVGIQQSLDILSLANAWVFITTTVLVITTFLAILFSGLDTADASFSLYLSWFLTIAMLTLVSFASLLAYYPDEFTNLTIVQVFAGFNYYNMLFAVYVLRSQDLYYLVVAGVMLVQAFIYLSIMNAQKKRKVIKHV